MPDLTRFLTSREWVVEALRAEGVRHVFGIPGIHNHELRQAGALGALRRLAKKGLEVIADDGVEEALLRRSGLVGPGLPGQRAGRVGSNSAWG